MIVKIVKEEDKIYFSYSMGTIEVKELFDYSSIERLIDYIMDNNIEEFTVEKNEECSQYVLLIESIFEKIKTEDFKKTYSDVVLSKSKVDFEKKDEK